MSKALCGAAATAERYCELWAGGPERATGKSAGGAEPSVSPVGFGAPGKQSSGLFSAKNGRQPRAFVEGESEAEA